MGGQAAKKKKAENDHLLSQLRQQASVINMVHVFVRFILQRGSLGSWSIVGTLTLLSINCVCYMALLSNGRPAYEGNTLIYGGGDLNSGMLEYVWDVLYISWFVEVGSLITNYAWLALLSIPFYAFWRLWWDLIKPWIFDEGIFAKTEVEESKTQRKKRVRAERFGVGRRQ